MLDFAEQFVIVWQSAQLFDNLVGRNEVIRQIFLSNNRSDNDPVAGEVTPFEVSQKSKSRVNLNRSNESLIPAQNQRWRRA